MRGRLTVAVLVAVLAFYAALIGAKGVALLGSDSPVGMLLGVGILLVPLLGGFLVWREVQFGRRSAELAGVLDSEGGLPVDDLPRRPSGRVDRAAADAVFATRRAEAEKDPENWRCWYLLGVAYDDAGDRSRARAAVRHAIALFDRHGRSA
jgi:cytochrome c-type biogenesis protein CcmH/NrfG